MMLKRDVIWSHVEALLERMLDVDSVAHNGGAWPIRAESGAYTVRIDGATHPHVEVFAAALHDLAITPEALAEVNDQNADSSHACWFLDEDRFIIASALVGGTLDYEEWYACARKSAFPSTASCRVLLRRTSVASCRTPTRPERRWPTWSLRPSLCTCRHLPRQTRSQ